MKKVSKQEALNGLHNVSKAFATAAAFYLGYTLMRIRHLVVQRQREQDEAWQEAMSNDAEE